jgi:hypothetical protein
MRILSVVVMAAMFGATVAAQQPPDEEFRFPIANPAYAPGTGPRVCMDVAHHNFQSAARNPGAYQPFDELVRSDGYRVQPFVREFTAESLAECDLLVIAGATADANVPDWAFPHPSAFAREELEALHGWIRQGGGLLLIADHAPNPGSAADLGTLLGVVMVNGYARLGPGPYPDVFSRRGGHLSQHAILRGRDEAERVDAIASFVGHAFHGSREWSPLLRFGPESFAWVPLSFNFSELSRELRPQFSIPGWLHAAARKLEKGRVVWLGEVSICTALRLGDERRPIGMNHPLAAQNAQFCLNVMRWLSGLLED